jgi:hypothetical protein
LLGFDRYREVEYLPSLWFGSHSGRRSLGSSASAEESVEEAAVDTGEARVTAETGAAVVVAQVQAEEEAAGKGSRAEVALVHG